jgi:shikimate kinase
MEEMLNEGIGVLASVENFEFNVDAWRRGEVRALFLSGLSGSGKTTYGQRLSKESGATLRSLDRYLKPLLREKYGPFDAEGYQKAVFDHAVKELLQDNKGRVIIEGGQVCWMNPEELRQHAVVVVGTSFLASTWRAIKRDFERDHWQEYGTIEPHTHTKFNLKTFAPLNDVMRKLSSDVQDQ